MSLLFTYRILRDNKKLLTSDSYFAAKRKKRKKRERERGKKQKTNNKMNK